MKIFHVDEPREIGKKKERVSSKDIMMIKKDLTERIVKKKLKELINEQVKPGDAFQSVGGNVDVIIDKFMGG